MKRLFVIACCICLSIFSFGQTEGDGLSMISNYSSDNAEMHDLLRFQGIEYYKISFKGEELRNKSYTLNAKEIWDGKCISDSVMITTKGFPFESLAKVNDTVLNMKVMAQLTPANKLKMRIGFDRFSITKEFDAIASDDYSLRNIAQESNLEIGYNDKFYLLAYILPYEMEDGSKSWCEVGSSGKDIENWGEKFGIKHYILFEMQFTDYVAPEKAD